MRARSSTHARSNARDAHGISGIRGASVGRDSGFRAPASRAAVPLRRAAEFRGAPKLDTVRWMRIDRLQPNWRRVAGRRNSHSLCFARWQGLLARPEAADRPKAPPAGALCFGMKRRVRLPIVNWFLAFTVQTTQSSGTALLSPLPPRPASLAVRTDGWFGRFTTPRPGGGYLVGCVAGSLPNWHSLALRQLRQRACPPGR